MEFFLLLYTWSSFTMVFEGVTKQLVYMTAFEVIHPFSLFKEILNWIEEDSFVFLVLNLTLHDVDNGVGLGDLHDRKFIPRGQE